MPHPPRPAPLSFETSSRSPLPPRNTTFQRCAPARIDTRHAHRLHLEHEPEPADEQPFVLPAVEGVYFATDSGDLHLSGATSVGKKSSGASCNNGHFVLGPCVFSFVAHLATPCTDDGRWWWRVHQAGIALATVSSPQTTLPGLTVAAVAVCFNVAAILCGERVKSLGL